MLSWFTTSSGRLFTRTAVGFASASVFGAHVALHGPFLDKYREIVSLYDTEGPLPLDESTVDLTQKVLEEINITKEEKEKISFFTVVGHDVFHAGGKNSPWGAIVGLPFYFHTKKKLNLNRLKLAGVDDFCFSIDGQELMDSLRLSEQAKKFAIAREIYSSDIKPVLENAAVAALFTVLIPARLCHVVNKKYNMFRFPVKNRILFYSAFYAVGFLFYCCVKHPARHISEKNCDKKVASISKEYLMGGIEFYEKSLSKNKELRQLMGSRGEKLYTKDGNKNYILFAPKLPLSKRLEFLQEMNKTETVTT